MLMRAKCPRHFAFTVFVHKGKVRWAFCPRLPFATTTSTESSTLTAAAAGWRETEQKRPTFGYTDIADVYLKRKST